MFSKRLVGIGGATVDLLLQTRRPIVLRDSNPGQCSFSAGGVMRNICENAARMGLESHLISAVGNDSLAPIILDSCRAAGVGTDHIGVLEGASTAVYVSSLDCSGDMYVAFSDIRVIERLTAAHLDAAMPLIQTASVVCLDGNPAPRFLDEAARRVHRLQIPLFFDPVSTAHAEKFKDLVGRFHTAKPNLLELQTLSGVAVTDRHSLGQAAQALLDAGLFRLFVTMGARGVYYADRDGNRRFYPAPDVAVRNATGAGDAFMAGLLLAHVRELSLDDTLALATGSAARALQSLTTVDSSPRLDGVIHRESEDSP